MGPAADQYDTIGGWQKNLSDQYLEQADEDLFKSGRGENVVVVHFHGLDIDYK